MPRISSGLPNIESIPMKSAIFSLLLVFTAAAQADCATKLPVKGVLKVDNCTPVGPTCVPAGEAISVYAGAQKDDGPEVLSIALHGSPWRLYDAEYHIVGIDELAGMVKKQGRKIKRVVLYASWSGVPAEPGGKSIAQKLSAALNGMPVTGQDGFAWYAQDGKVSTTHQASTVVRGGPYSVPKGTKVMASLVAGWYVSGEPEYTKQGDAIGLMRVGVGADIYLLCPERALKAFEASAALLNPVAAYNAGIMRLERGNPGDRQAAVQLLKRSAAFRDVKALAKLVSMGALR